MCSKPYVSVVSKCSISSISGIVRVVVVVLFKMYYTTNNRGLPIAPRSWNKRMQLGSGRGGGGTDWRRRRSSSNTHLSCIEPLHIYGLGRRRRERECAIVKPRNWLSYIYTFILLLYVLSKISSTNFYFWIMCNKFLLLPGRMVSSWIS